MPEEKDCKKAMLDALYSVVDFVASFNAKEGEGVLKNLGRTLREKVDNAAKVCKA